MPAGYHDILSQDRGEDPRRGLPNIYKKLSVLKKNKEGSGITHSQASLQGSDRYTQEKPL